MQHTPAITQALPAGTRLEEFVIERVLGSGGFGITYLARDARLGRQVVIKENLPVQFCFRDTHSLTVAPRHFDGEDEANFRWSLENFSKEAAMLASLDHPGIVRVHRSFEAFGTAYFVMPFVAGATLEEVILSRRGQGRDFSEEKLRGLLERTLDALAHLHDRGIYHRDIKPGNILIANEGVPVLIDFGSARQRLSERSMTVVESAGYTPFEQLQSRGNVGPWSDLYALGGTLCKVLTGEAPPKANDRAFDDPLVPLADRQELAGSYSPEFLASIDRALAARVADRWQNAAEWLAALGVRSNRIELEAGRAPVSPPPAEARMPVARGSRRARNKALLALAACVVVVGLGYSWSNASKSLAAKRDKLARQAVELSQQQERARLAEEEQHSVSMAMAALGIHKQLSELSVDELAAIGYYRQAAEMANVAALCDLGRCYQNGTGVAKDEAEAAKWYRKAADAGDGFGMFNLGFCFENGSGIRKDTAEAVKWYLKAATAGNEIGMCFLGLCYANSTGVAKDEAEAARWFYKAAEAGDKLAIIHLGLCYVNGAGVAKDEAEAENWFRKARTAGDGRYGSEAAKWYLMAAEAGDGSGMYLLGVCYKRGTGVAKNEAEAVKWCRKAAEEGVGLAMHELGKYYINGFGVAKDMPEAVKWYRKAAEAGDGDGMLSLAICYDSGIGVAKDETEAVKWYRKAAEVGDEVARILADDIERRLEIRSVRLRK